MTLYYLDASALVKYYILEPGSTWIRALVDDPANVISISDASITESAAAFAILCRMKQISQSIQQNAFRAMMVHVARGPLRAIPLATDDFQLAAHLTQRRPLRAYDAVQLAVAIRHNHILSKRGLETLFVCGDNALVAAAQAEGLPTDNPFEHVLPQDTLRSHA